MSRAFFFNRVCKKKHIYTSDYLASERMKFICAVNIYASGTVTALQQLSINTKKNFIPQLRVKKNKQKDQIVENSSNELIFELLITTCTCKKLRAELPFIKAITFCYFPLQQYIFASCIIKTHCKLIFEPILRRGKIYKLCLHVQYMYIYMPLTLYGCYFW